MISDAGSLILILIMCLYYWYQSYSDSDYSIKCATTYGEKQEKINWKNNIPNKELVKEIYTIFSKYKNIKIKYIKAHTKNEDENSLGNKIADKLAVLSLS